MSQAQGRAAGPASCRRVLLFGVLPFVAGIWLVLITFRHQGLPGRLRPAAAQTLGLRQNCSQALAGGACDCGDGTAAGNVSAGAALASRLGGGMLESVLGGRNGSVAAGGQAAGGDALENIFLFVGILSGRGYRHRRLAGRHRRARCTPCPGVCAHALRCLVPRTCNVLQAFHVPAQLIAQMAGGRPGVSESGPACFSPAAACTAGVGACVHTRLARSDRPSCAAL